MTKTATNEIDRLASRYSKSRRGISTSEELRLVQAIVRANKKPPAIPTRRLVPEGYVALTEIQTSLVNRMWAGFGAAEFAAKALSDAGETGKRGSGFGPRRAYVAAALERAFLTGKLTLYVAADPTRLDPIPSWAKSPMPVPKYLIGYVFIGVPNRMPGTFAIRPSRRVVGNDRLFAMIQRGQLVVRENEVRHWFRSQRKKRRWPSQQGVQCARNPVGRPNKLTAELKAAILEIDRQRCWHGKRSLTELHRLLVEQGLLVSVDTIGRLVDKMFAETGNPRLRRPIAFDESRDRRHLPQNYVRPADRYFRR